MKLLGKIGVILLAALVVAGATLALGNSGALSGLTGGGPGERGERGEWPDGAPADAGSAFAPGERPARGEFRGGEGDRDGGAGGLLGVARNLGLVATVVAGVWLIGRVGGRVAIRRKLGKAEMPPAKEQMTTEEKL